MSFPMKDSSYSALSCPRSGQRSGKSSWSHRIFPVANRRRHQTDPTNFSAVSSFHAPQRSLSEQNPSELPPPTDDFVAVKQGRRSEDHQTNVKNRHMMWPHTTCHQRRTFSPQKSTRCPSFMHADPCNRQAVLLQTRRSPPIY